MCEDKIEIKIKDMPYKIIIKLEKETLFLEGESLEKFPKEEYSNNYTLNDLRKSNNIFKLYDDMKQVYDQIQKSYKNQQLRLLTESDNLTLKIPVNLDQLEDIHFILVKKPIDLLRAVLDLKEMNKEKDQQVSELKFSVIALENRLKDTLKEHKDEIETLKKDYHLQNNKIQSLNDKLEESKKMINQKGKEIEKLNKELYIFKNDKNKEIKNLNNEVNDLKKKFNELEENFNNMEKKFREELDEKLDEKYEKAQEYIDVLDVKLFYLREINAEEVKKNYKNSDFFKDIMNKYYSHISFLNSHYVFRQESKYKQSYESICDCIFEELNEKNGKNFDTILEFEANNYNNYLRAQFNAFFIKNAIHQAFYSDLYGTNKEIFNKISDKILKFEKLDNIYSRAKSSKYDIEEYFKTFKILDFIKLYKKIIL